MKLRLPPIRVTPAGLVLAGPWRLEPSHPDWKRRRCYWRAVGPSGPATDWLPTPRMALWSALYKSGA